MRMASALAAIVISIVLASDSGAEVRVLSVEGQPLGANIRRVIEAHEFLGHPLDRNLVDSLNEVAKRRDSLRLQELLDPHVLFVVSLNPEVRVKVARGPAKATLQQGGFTPVLVKIINESTVTRQMRIMSPHSGPVYAGASLTILKRQQQTELNDNENTDGATDRFLDLEMFQSSPMSKTLSGLEIEYAIALIYSSEYGKREATISFDVGAGTQDLGFRAETPVLFDIQRAVPVTLSVRDHDEVPTVARFEFRDVRGRVYPSQAKRLAPDFFFQPQIYRADGEVAWLPPGEFSMTYSRGPEYRVRTRRVQINTPAEGDDSTDQTIDVKLDRWVNPMDYGFYCGDHHIHGAGCSHYTLPTEGVTPQDMFRQVKGEGLNVGCILTWGPCFDHQRNYFAPIAHDISEPLTVMKYDLEISGFGSAALGHVCLLNLRDQTYPGSDGTKTKGWPTWTVPVLRWCKEQGGVTGYPHSAMRVNPELSAARLLELHDDDESNTLSESEAASALLPESFAVIDSDGDRSLTETELTSSANRAADQLPNLAVPSMNGGGAMEICVSTAEGVCDFISAMDTDRIPEWNAWYHLMNCGFPLKVSGETDFPCMSSRRVGQGRVYVHLGDVDRIEFATWCRGIAAGQSYVSDGYAHAVEFAVNGQRPGRGDVQLNRRGRVQATATVIFAPELPRAVAYGTLSPAEGRRVVGDTITLHAPRGSEMVEGGTRRVELVVNGEAVASKTVPADGRPHELSFDVEIGKSSWVAVRQFPQLHTNPVNVMVGRSPIRASRESALWCIETIRLLWKNRHTRIAESERPAARAAYDRAIAKFAAIAREAE